ncbi:hypothetical protein A2403_02395 [Candidatus Roizmanbacteria bacterium RIFOXYC1_FULL_41_16]|nr:MAG: hypothetical protein A2377_02315 [Candidatus Roizmanbacteria bacterium RIFOXYB1_FULL_41_27]OGK69058.1 MAG: hypothetical protein A2262_00815 [Candidatus Roizmanbacteria bacterium RIFOXYA2_FULL_41_8]OGK70906.1 MAG: hypothetical protein A2403_02395 [Candidatus Roizmanbacteria bacterium RIFOXYC1_FULL_41_16]OGK72602.1 MAG: hypothetical protein A2459_04485 [Candidatus Roizmanbacteria bacterium RIFOXYC2_FULL_41_10]
MIKKIRNLIFNRFKKKSNNKARYLKTIFLVLFSAVLTFFVFRQLSLWQLRWRLQTQAPLLAVYDPLDLKHEIQTRSSQIAIIDLRLKKEFAQGHIRSSYNLPWQTDLNLWLKNFKALKLKGQKLIFYQYSSASVAPQKAALYLKKVGWEAYYLAIGYNEWRHFPNFWLPEKDWEKWELERFVTLPEK